jgi:hypothetical protein
MRFHNRRSKIKHRAEKKHRDPQARILRRLEIRNGAEMEHKLSHAGQDFNAGDQRSERELRRTTKAHKLNRNLWQKVSDQKQS